MNIITSRYEFLFTDKSLIVKGEGGCLINFIKYSKIISLDLKKQQRSLGISANTRNYLYHLDDISLELIQKIFQKLQEKIIQNETNLLIDKISQLIDRIDFSPGISGGKEFLKAEERQKLAGNLN